jgi:hypothetical protein
MYHHHHLHYETFSKKKNLWREPNIYHFVEFSLCSFTYAGSLEHLFSRESMCTHLFAVLLHRF